MGSERNGVQRKVTMADVARLAGVGKMTVSRYLSGNGAISKKTAERVHRAIQILKYQPNEVARSLRAVNSKTIGVVVPYLYGPFFSTCAHAISSVARFHGYSVILTTSDEKPDTEQEQTNLMLRRQVNGLVVVPVAGNEQYYTGEAFAGIPMVTIDRPAPGLKFDSVLVPNRSGAKMGVDHLIGHGHKRIGFLGLSRTLYTMKARYSGYCDAMIGAGLAPEPYVDCESPERAKALVSSMLDRNRPPTALFTANNLTSKYVLQALIDLGIEIPHRIALVGFDDLEMATVLQPPVTVIRQPVFKLGEVAANILFQRIGRGEGPGPKVHRVVLPVELVVRSSCGCPKPKNGSGTDAHKSTVALPNKS